MEEIVEIENKKQSRRWLLTINNPNQSDEEFKNYLEDLEHIKYAIYQREKGHETGTEHFQVFVIFTIGKRFSTIKNYFPTAHIEQAKGSNVQCRDYCSKSDTRISGPYEIGQFAEERARTDFRDFMELVEAGSTNYELKQLYPHLFMQYCDKLPTYRLTKNVDYSKQLRDMEVTYVYGDAGAGKSTYVHEKTINDNVFWVSSFDLSAFTGYQGEETIIIDEYKGQFKLQTLNRILDGFPFKVRGLGSLSNACFTKVFIISNFSYLDLYKDEQKENSGQYEGFVRRLHHILRFEKNVFEPKVERYSIFEDIPEEDRKPYGHKQRVRQMIEYDRHGISKVIYDVNRPALVEISDDDLPF